MCSRWVAAVVAVASISFIGSAPAADIATKAPAYKAPPPVALYNWTGIYLGMNGGYGWARENWLDNTAPAPGASITHRPEGGVFGGQIGFRWQWNQLVLGIEGTWDWAGLSKTVTSPFGFFTEEFKVKSLYTATGQVGWAWDRFLIYAKGGWAGATTGAYLSGLAVPVTASNSPTVNGWTVGGGVDYAIWQNLIFGIEYDHFDFRYHAFTAPVSNGGTPWFVTNTSRLTADQVVARLSYKFDWQR